MTYFRESDFKRENRFAGPAWSKSIDIKQCENTNDPGRGGFLSAKKYAKNAAAENILILEYGGV